MALSIEQIIQSIAPKVYADPNLNDYIELAKLSTGTCFGDKYNYAVALRASHIGTLAKRNGNEAGSLTGKKVGGVSLSFSKGAGANGSVNTLDATHYGIQLKSMIKNLGKRISVTGASSTLLMTGLR